ncbi:DNA-binding HxlR family transcriptional regulator [Methanococcus maripaludis]|uniref:DNA-binding HxlR family transcriptional regulator n=1 Tax=Methanococcus maripaludis TaxID=39152 RepID=A0A7J9P6H1_METMI|nr:winged helix-turn-helix domain-containing protein [Methanococcus maripaludis]MBA2858317.1 DNA-binding HxlR family transcriptional regulator [Methanococcus maripaludis]
MLLNIISKKNTRAVLELLRENEEMYFSEIQRELDMNLGSLNRILNELMTLNILDKRKDSEDVALPKAYYFVTDYGEKVVELYDLEKDLEKESKIINQTNIKGNVKNVVNMGDNATVNLK